VRGSHLGFAIDEVMTGEHEFEPGFGPPGRHALEFRVTWGAKNLGAFLDPRKPGFLRADLEGHITVGGLCEDAPCQGVIEMRYFTDHAIEYRFDFEVDGRPYRFVGRKVNIRPWNLPVSHTTCFGTLVHRDRGLLVSRSVTFFRLRRLLEFMASLRLIMRPLRGDAEESVRDAVGAPTYH
jgi:hypothetical protein